VQAEDDLSIQVSVSPVVETMEVSVNADLEKAILVVPVWEPYPASYLWRTFAHQECFRQKALEAPVTPVWQYHPTSYLWSAPCCD